MPRFQGMKTKKEKKKGYVSEFLFAHYGLTWVKEQ
jgi:hypothetical protein